MNLLSEYGLFLLQILTIVIAILATVFGVIAISARDRLKKNTLVIKNINDRYDDMRDTLSSAVLDKKTFRKYQKDLKKQAKAKAKDKTAPGRIFVITFTGDIKASPVDSLREEITAILSIAKPEEDEVVVVLESMGGIVSHYGFAASQLQRLRDKKIPLTVCVDKVAASGGYLMACVADKILAAPFAIIGSIGVVAQIPNFHRLLKKNNIDFELLTAGEYKRTLTMFGENTDKARKKLKEELESIYDVFKDFLTKHRPKLNIHEVATGEYWLAEKAFDLRLVDQLLTSDDYLLNASQQNKDLYEICYQRRQNMIDKMSSVVSATIDSLIEKMSETRQQY